MANTLSEIRERVYKLTGEPSDSVEYSNSYINELINEVQDNITKGDVVSEIDNRHYKVNDLRFMRKKQFINYVPQVSLTADVATTDTEISFSTTNFASSGYINIEGDVIQYTGKSATQITGVTGISTTHSTSSQVRQVYLIPSTAWKGFRLEIIKGSTTYKNYYGGKFLEYRDFRAEKDILQFWTVLGDDESTSNQFLDIYGYNSTEDKFIFHYRKKSTDMTIDADTTDLPDNYGRSVLAPIVAGKVLYNTDEAIQGQFFLKEGYAKLDSMYTQFADQVDEYSKKIKTKAFDLTSLRSVNNLRNYCTP